MWLSSLLFPAVPKALEGPFDQLQHESGRNGVDQRRQQWFSNHCKIPTGEKEVRMNTIKEVLRRMLSFVYFTIVFCIV